MKTVRKVAREVANNFLFCFLQQGKDSSYVTVLLPVEVTYVQLLLILVIVCDYHIERTKGIFFFQTSLP